MISHPSQLEWIEGDLPDVHTVSKNCRALVWLVTDIPKSDYSIFKQFHSDLDPEEINGKLQTIEITYPWENDLNPLRWEGMWHWAKVKYYAWIVPPD
jgi:hypothetical protein